MASAQGIRAGRAFIELGLSGLGKVQAGLKSLKTAFVQLAKIGAGAVAAITAAGALAVRTFAKMGDEIQKASLRTGLGARELTQLKHAAEEADVSFQALQNGLLRMRRERPGRTIEEVADEINGLASEAEKAERAYEIFGRQGLELLPLLKQGSDEIRRQRMEAERLGIVMTDDEVNAAAELTDQMAALSKQVKAFLFQLGAWIVRNTDLIDTLQRVSHWLGDILAFVRSDQLGLAWEMMWRGMAISALTVLSEVSSEMTQVVEDAINLFRRAQNMTTAIGATIVSFFNRDMADEMAAMANERQNNEVDLQREINRSIDRNKRRLEELRRQAAKTRVELTRSGMGPGATAAARMANFGTLDTAQFLRFGIGAQGGMAAIEERMLEAEMRTAEATEETAAAMKRQEKLWNQWFNSFSWK